MTKCNKEKIDLPACKGRKVQAEFVEEAISSDGGVLLLREIDRKINLTPSLSKLIPDPRNQHMIIHSQLSLLQQRIYGIALGYEDLARLRLRHTRCSLLKVSIISRSSAPIEHIRVIKYTSLNGVNV